MMNEQFPNLAQFFGGCFNQDWALDDPTPEAVVRRFVAENSQMFVTDVLTELDQFLNLGISDAELQRFVYEEFNSYFQPDPGIKMRDWLLQIRGYLRLPRAGYSK
jgi:CdiI immunity protein